MDISKKAVVVTVYNSENCGSFLQAYCMRAILNKLGYDVAFYKRDTKGTSHEFMKHIRPFLRNLYHLRFKTAWWELKKWFVFQSYINKFNVCDKDSEFYKKADVVILGSDTIWNFNSLYFTNKANVYTGQIFNGKKVISYAVPAANTTKEKFINIVKRLIYNLI